MSPVTLTSSRYTIGQLVRRFGVTHRAIRFYEQIGLLEPTREGPQRTFGRRDYQRLGVIGRARKAGLALEQVRELLDLYDPADGGAAQLNKAVERLKQRIADLDAQRDVANTELAALETQLYRLRPSEAGPADAERYREVGALASSRASRAPLRSAR